MALAAGLALTWVGLGSDTDEARRKGSGQPTGDMWAGVQVYRLPVGGQPVPLEKELDASDNLLFAYTNAGPEPFTHLMIFGVGATGEVFWYSPGWLHEGEDPAAIPIQASATPVELHERISQPLPAGRFVLHAVFTRRPLRVSEVERLLAGRAPGLDEPLPLPDTAQQRSMLEVN